MKNPANKERYPDDKFRFFSNMTHSREKIFNIKWVIILSEEIHFFVQQGVKKIVFLATASYRVVFSKNVFSKH